MKNSWFDLIPKSISNKVITELQSNQFTIPWLPLNVQNIDLKNGNFGEGLVFIDKNEWLNIQAKKNLIKFINKMISWDINEPLSVKAIANETSRANPMFLQNEFLKANIKNNLGWNYTKIKENLKKPSSKS